MLQLHKLPIFQWLEFLHLAQVIPGVLGDDSGFPDCFNFVVLPWQHVTSKVAAGGKEGFPDLSLALQSGSVIISAHYP